MLLIRATDPADGRSFLIPPGGGVEFGELLDDAIRRELREELGLEVASPRRIGMLENVFRYAGSEEHELVFVYVAECEDAQLVRTERIEIDENGRPMEARWYTTAELIEKRWDVFPAGLLALLRDGS
jgi:ADP-ribose pyrophosphatase YjhB (NUDIX family)